MSKKTILLFAGLFCAVLCSAQNFKFNHICSEQGLDGNAIDNICEDIFGNMWFASDCGLYRFNGMDLRVFRHESDNIFSLPNDRVTDLFSADDGKLWISTDQELAVYHQEEDRFYRVNHLNRVMCIGGMLDGRLVVSTKTDCYSINPADLTYKKEEKLSGEYLIYSLHVWDDKAFVATTDNKVIVWDGQEIKDVIAVEERVKTILETSPGEYWMGTEGAGLFRLNINSGIKESYKKGPGRNDISSNFVRCLCRDHEGHLLAGTVNGLNIINLETGEISKFFRDPADVHSLSHNSVKSLYMDRRGVIWLGTYYGGVNYYNPKFSRIQTLSQNSSKDALNDNVACYLCADDNDEIWVGTNKGGVNLWNTKTGTVSHYLIAKNLTPSSEESNDIKAIFSSNSSKIYIGVHEGGLNILDRKTGRIDRVKEGPASVYSICQVAPEHLLLGADSGLYLFNERTGKIQNTGVSNKTVLVAKKDSEGIVWTIMEGKLRTFRINADGDVNEIYYANLEDVDFPIDFIDCPDGVEYIASGEGLYRYDKVNEELTLINKGSDFPDKHIVGVEKDSEGNIWVSTLKELCKYNPESGKTRILSSNEGLDGNTFLPCSHTSCRDGRLAFGGVGGVTLFDPSSISIDEYCPTPIIYSLEMFGKQILPGDGSGLLSKDISFTDKLIFPHGKNSFTFKFSIPNFLSIGNGKFEYRMVGLNNEWHSTNTGIVSYENIRKGTYRFEVKFCNPDGFWSENVKTINVRVLPGWYESVWFISIMAAIILGCIFAVVLFAIKQRALKSKLKMEEMQRRHEQEINDLKISLVLKGSESDNVSDNLEEKNRQFLLKAIDIVESNMSNSDFSIDKFAAEMNMSRSNLHIRMKKVAGCSALEFIYKIRIAEACRLLRGGNLTAAEVGYKVGAKTPSYFNISFKRYMGCTPMEYANKVKYN